MFAYLAAEASSTAPDRLPLGLVDDNVEATFGMTADVLHNAALPLIEPEVPVGYWPMGPIFLQCERRHHLKPEQATANDASSIRKPSLESDIFMTSPMQLHLLRVPAGQHLKVLGEPRLGRVSEQQSHGVADR